MKNTVGKVTFLIFAIVLGDTPFCICPSIMDRIGSKIHSIDSSTKKRLDSTFGDNFISTMLSPHERSWESRKEVKLFIKCYHQFAEFFDKPTNFIYFAYIPGAFAPNSDKQAY